MTNEPHSLALLRRANPFSVDTAAASSPQARGLFAEIVEQPRGRSGGGRKASNLGLRSRLAVGGAGLGAVIAAVIVAVFSGSTAAPAFAGWTAKPTAAVSQQIKEATRDCHLSGPVLVETRGPYTAAVFASRSGGTACVGGPGMSFEASVGGVRAPDNRFKPNQIGMAVSTGGNATGHGFTVLTGRIGTAVRSVVIHRSNHTNVIASINGGWYLAWWPAGAHATYATVTTTTGSHRVALPSLATTNPSCHIRLPSRWKNRPHPFSVGCAAAGGTSFPNTVAKSNGPGSDGISGPPMVGQIVGEPFHGTVLFNVWNASSVLVCFHPPADLNAAMQPNGPTGPCTHATLLTRLPPHFPVQKNLLELFPKGVWETRLPVKSRNQGTQKFLVIPHGSSGDGLRSELIVTR
jgi:hypothetical protein